MRHHSRNNEDGVGKMFWERINFRVASIAAALLLAFNGASAGPDEDLLLAVEIRNLAKAESALGKKANPEARKRNGATALMLASELGHVGIAKLLLSAGANVATTREGGISAVHHAAGGGRVETLKLLLESGASVSARTDLGVTPLIAAGRSGKVEVLKALLEAGADRSERDNNGLTAFITSAQSGCVECLQLVRVPGGDVNAKTVKGDSALDYAVVSRSLPTFQYLFEQGATFDAAKSAKDEVLFSFITSPDDVMLRKPPSPIETYRFLIARGASLEPRNEKGQTPLIWAARMNDAAAVQALIEAKADIHARDKQEATALAHAAGPGILAGARMIMAIAQGASVKQAFAGPAEKSDKSPVTATRHTVVRALLQAGADVNAVDKDGNTTLHKATEIGDVELVQLLLAAGANVNARTRDGGTALMTTSAWNFPECTAALLAAGADPTLATESGGTAMSIAKMNKHKEVIKLLNAAGKK
jgi:serine/threonine-protein phosphatase 6 regulatory ankyrin repeat subunit B